jgi:hypothetical protein
MSEVHGHLATRHRTDRNQVGDIVGQQGALEGRLLLEDGDSGLEVRWLNVGDEAPLEARPQALLSRQ